MPTLMRPMRVTTTAQTAFQASSCMRDIVLLIPNVPGVGVFIGTDGGVSPNTGVPLIPGAENRYTLAPDQPVYIVTDAAGGVTIGIIETEIGGGSPSPVTTGGPGYMIGRAGGNQHRGGWK